jgi:predicted amidohydrolase
MVAVVQFNPVRGRKDENLAALVRLTESALSAGARLVVLPEMAAVGYRFPDAAAVRPFAEPAAGPTLRAFAPLAMKYWAQIVVGFVEDAGQSGTVGQAAGGTLFNSAMVIGPDGRLAAVYRKRLLYDDDFRWAAPGDTPYPLFDTPYGRATVGICMDINDDRFVEFLHRAKPAVVCFPTNWIDEGRDDIHDYWAYRLAGRRGLFLAADRWGEEDGVRFWGRSAILRDGRVVTSAPAAGDACRGYLIPGR